MCVAANVSCLSGTPILEDLQRGGVGCGLSADSLGNKEQVHSYSVIRCWEGANDFSVNQLKTKPLKNIISFKVFLLVCMKKSIFLSLT